MRKKLKKIYKELRNYYFSILYKKINLKGAFKPKFKTLKNLKIKKYPYKVYMIQNCRIYTNCVENVSIIKNNQLIPEGSMQQINGKLVNARKNEVLKTKTLINSAGLYSVKIRRMLGLFDLEDYWVKGFYLKYSKKMKRESRFPRKR